MGKPLTNAPRGTYRNLAQFETAGNFPADGQTPQPLLKGDGTESPLAFTATKAFVNGVEVGDNTVTAAVGATSVTSSGDIYTTGENATIYTNGADASIFTTGAEATISTSGSDATIYTNGANASIQSRSTFKLYNGTHTTTLSHSPTANHAIVFPDKDGTVAMVDAETHTGAHAFSSTTRPTSSGTGPLAPTSLITTADGDGRYGRIFSGISIDSVFSSNTTPIKVASVLLPIGLYYIDSLVSSIHGGGLCTIGLQSNQPLGINVIESYGNDLTAHITNPIGADGFTSATRSATTGTTFSRRVAGIVQITTTNTELSIQFSQSMANATPSFTRKRAYITATKLS